MDNRALVFFGAHPDDETFGLGGTLAHYALRGVKVYYACATLGEAGTVDPQFKRGAEAVVDVRLREMECAAKKLGLAGVIYLGFRDSGMFGSTDNRHPDALVNAPVEKAAASMVRVIRSLKPQVVVTHDAGGGYGHPDHVAVHLAAVRAFHDAGDPACYPEAGPAYRPQKLYFIVHPRRSMRLAIKLMPLFGQDPKHAGRNRDIDFTRMADVEYPVHAVVTLSKKDIKRRDEATACHASQLGGRRSRSFIFRFLGLLDALRGPRDHFMRAFPPPGGKCERDLFEEVNGK
jgi:LmbE family N-acetylglucosaminyl deacetylase